MAHLFRTSSDAHSTCYLFCASIVRSSAFSLSLSLVRSVVCSITIENGGLGSSLLSLSSPRHRRHSTNIPKQRNMKKQGSQRKNELKRENDWLRRTVFRLWFHRNHKKKLRVTNRKMQCILVVLRDVVIPLTQQQKNNDDKKEFTLISKREMTSTTKNEIQKFNNIFVIHSN